MTDNYWYVILLFLAALIAGAAAGFFLGRRTSRDQQRIKQLEEELVHTRNEQEKYRAHVNEHFQKTSELFSRMTDSYKAVFLHLAEGSQELCSSGAAMLKPADGRFMVLEHEKEAAAGQTAAAGQSAQKPPQPDTRGRESGESRAESAAAGQSAAGPKSTESSYGRDGQPSSAEEPGRPQEQNRQQP